ncbi:MAG: hypothetical protein KDA94_16675 [Acidimicrobiales bacterium]|nr:hypothetical protein [Acidimicrobiales bacterium]
MLISLTGTMVVTMVSLGRRKLICCIRLSRTITAISRVLISRWTHVLAYGVVTVPTRAHASWYSIKE